MLITIMSIWIEVTGNYQWQLRLSGTMGLNSPVNTRYKNMLCKINNGDIVLHHITTQRSEKKELASSIVGISKVKTKMQILSKLLVDLEETTGFPIPIRFKEYSKIENPSDNFKFLIHTNLQKYIFEIDKSDFEKILQIKKENVSYFKANKNYRNFI